MEVLAQRDIVFSGRLFSVERLRTLDDRGATHERDVVRHPGAVAIIAVHDAEGGGEGEIVLIRNFRAAVGDSIWEIPAGTLGPGELPRAAAARELREETGYAAGELQPLGAFYTSPGLGDELMHVFEARGLVAGGQQLEGGEHIEVHCVPARRAVQMACDGTIRDGKTIAALLLWARRGAGGRPAAGVSA